MSKLLSAVDEIVTTEEVKDPREDLRQDSKLWVELLKKARSRNYDLYCELHGFRCMGTRIKRTQRGKYVLRPDIGPDAWKSQEDYEKTKQRLYPHLETIAGILEELSQENDEEPEG